MALLKKNTLLNKLHGQHFTMLLIILLVPFNFFLGQEKYSKSEHVEIDCSTTDTHYIINYIFKDHKKHEHQFNMSLEKHKTDTMIEKYGLPKSYFKNSKKTDSELIEKRKKIAKESFFIVEGGVLKKDKKALVDYYKEMTSPIANFIIDYLDQSDQDTRSNRIEMAMKFVQDIPYGVPKEKKNTGKFGYITPPEILIEGYGDCDSKTILFVCIMSYLITTSDIIYVSTPGHIFSAIKDYDMSKMIGGDKEYVPYTQRTFNKLDMDKYIEFNDDIYFVCETAGSARPNYGENNKKLKLCYIETFDLSQIMSTNGYCYHSNTMSVNKENHLQFEFPSCFIYNPPTSYDMTKPID
tara:strand:+ start:1346 stop:2401 length:1056 start_codon:yes stop_codon:yes gene_type:complete